MKNRILLKVIARFLVLSTVLMTALPASGQTADATIQLPPSPPDAFNNLVVNPGTNLIYQSAGNIYHTPGAIYVISGATNSPPVTIIKTASAGGFMDLNPLTNKIYVAEMSPAQLSIIDAATGAIVASVPVPGIPMGIAVNPNTNRIYISSQGCPESQCDELFVIDGNSLSLMDANPDPARKGIPLGGVASMVRVNPSTNLIYAAVTPDSKLLRAGSPERLWLSRLAIEKVF